MKKIILFIAAGLFAGSTSAQKLPQPSPFAKVEQTVGLTDLTIAYSRPSVKGRTIFGELVPYGEVWRTGANAPTKFTCSAPVMFNEQTLEAGTYALFTIPAQDGNWTVVLNTDIEQWGAGDYEASKNVVSLKIKAMPTEFTETFTIGFSAITDESGAIVLSWDKTKIIVPFKVDTKQQAQKNIEEAIKKGEKLESVYSRAASYAWKSLKDEKLALTYIEKGLAVKETHNLYFLKAQLLKQQGETEQAILLAEKAHKLALAAKSKGWADYIQQTLDVWDK